MPHRIFNPPPAPTTLERPIAPFAWSAPPTPRGRHWRIKPSGPATRPRSTTRSWAFQRVRRATLGDRFLDGFTSFANGILTGTCPGTAWRTQNRGPCVDPRSPWVAGSSQKWSTQRVPDGERRNSGVRGGGRRAYSPLPRGGVGVCTEREVGVLRADTVMVRRVCILAAAEGRGTGQQFKSDTSLCV